MKGLKDGVNEVVRLIQGALLRQVRKTTLKGKEYSLESRQSPAEHIIGIHKIFSFSNYKVREKDQTYLFAQVTWCILGPRGVWQKVPVEVNYKLERNDVKDGIMDALSNDWRTFQVRKIS